MESVENTESAVDTLVQELYENELKNQESTEEPLEADSGNVVTGITVSDDMVDYMNNVQTGLIVVIALLGFIAGLIVVKMVWDRLRGV